MICSEIRVDTKQSNIWLALTGSQHLLCFNPFIATQLNGKVTGLGYQDQCTYENGKVLYREAVDYVEGTKIKYKINYAEEKHNNFTCFEAIQQNGKTCFRLTIETDAYKNVPRPIWYFVAYFFLIPSYKKYLNAVVNGMKQYCETKKKVAINQYGKHRGFSA